MDITYQVKGKFLLVNDYLCKESPETTKCSIQESPEIGRVVVFESSESAFDKLTKWFSISPTHSVENKQNIHDSIPLKLFEMHVRILNSTDKVIPYFDWVDAFEPIAPKGKEEWDFKLDINSETKRILEGVNENCIWSVINGDCQSITAGSRLVNLDGYIITKYEYPRTSFEVIDEDDLEDLM